MIDRTDVTANLVIDPASAPHRRYESMKRFMDIVVGGVGMVVTLPVLVVAAILVAVSSRSNPIMRQPRVGYRGEVFGMYKLRTMVAGPSPRHDPWSWAASGKPRTDERITRLGTILRRTSIDELPQFLNVLRGEMTLVGPRPMLESEVGRLTHAQLARFGVRPGMTGLWQITGRGSLAGSRWAEIDLAYVAKRSWAYDVGILLRTPWAVLTMKGAS